VAGLPNGWLQATQRQMVEELCPTTVASAKYFWDMVERGFRATGSAHHSRRRDRAEMLVSAPELLVDGTIEAHLPLSPMTVIAGVMLN
jgi:hypothetical protein